MSSTLTQKQEQQIVEWLAEHPTLTQGVGNAEAACSVAAWNLALTGKLTDKIPDCASEVIGRWIIAVQDRCPPEHGRGHPEWLRLLPLAAGTGRAHEAERLAIVLDWMWSTVLPSVQSIANQDGFGEQWRVMCETRTMGAAEAASWAAYAGRYAADKVYEGNAAHYAASYAANAADVEYAVDGYAAAFTAYAADAVDAVMYAADKDAWATFAPIEVLRKLIAVTDVRAVA
jgi:hypothetical protein